jgi:hypothetical protein
MNAYFFKMSQAERNNILDQHKQIYDGFVTTYGQQINQQPLYTQDFANDKGGVTVNNKGEVKTYTNMRINEMRHDGMNTGLFSDEEEEYSFVSPKKHFNGLDQIGDGEDDLEFGTMDDEDMDEVEYLLDLEIDEDLTIYEEVDEDMVQPLQEQLNKSLDMFRRFSKYK